MSRQIEKHPQKPENFQSFYPGRKKIPTVGGFKQEILIDDFPYCDP